jgi:hypothetical protein
MGMSGIQGADFSRSKTASSKITSAKPKNLKSMETNAQALHGAGQIPPNKQVSFQPNQGTHVTGQGLSLIG